MNKILVTGGAGFIGSALVRYLINNTDKTVINVDALTYAGNLESIKPVSHDSRHIFEQVDIRNQQDVKKIFEKHKPDAVIHLAAESHVDRSIEGPADFIQTNIIGTYNLLEIARKYWAELSLLRKSQFRFHHVSTDEVYGSLGTSGFFTEKTPYQPNSPYSASKASSDHLVRVWYHTYGLPVITINCSNNYGPCQFPEKLIPLMILNALEGKLLPIYGVGDNVQDWLYVDDHVNGLLTILEKGKLGETYNIGCYSEKTNFEVVNTLCELLDGLVSGSQNKAHTSLITYVDDRPGHDKCYAIDASRINREFNWQPSETFEFGHKKTISRYLDNLEWCRHVQDGSYQRERLGIATS